VVEWNLLCGIIWGIVCICNLSLVVGWNLVCGILWVVVCICNCVFGCRMEFVVWNNVGCSLQM
jgi:hypothetical protein